MVFTKR